jgi:hypothetical protein
VMRSLQKDPARRFDNGAALARALEALEPGAPVTLPARPRSWRRSTSLMVVVAGVAIAAALASGIRVSRSANTEDGAAARRRSIPVAPKAPVPPVPPSIDVPRGPPDGNPFDREEFERDLKEHLKTAVPRAGTLGLIAGARALQKANRSARAAELLRRSRDPIARLELYLIEKQLDSASAGTSLRQFARSVPPDEWPAPLLRAYLGEEKDENVIAKAEDADERCEANYYLGRLHAPSEPALARNQLAIAAADECDQSEFAREELQALQRR